MEPSFGIVAFAYLGVLGIVLSYINFTDITDFKFPGGYGVPTGLLVLGAGLYMFNDHGLSYMLRSLASGIFIGAIFYYMETQLDLNPDGE